MHISIIVKTGQSKEHVEEREGRLIVSVKAKPEHNKANKAVERLLEKHFHKKIKIIKGFRSSKKIIHLNQ